jgi:hypothetical protein
VNTAPSRFTREEMRRYVVDRVRLRQGRYDILTGQDYGPGMPLFRVSDNNTWRTLLVRAANAGHARRAAIEDPEAWGGWGNW